MDYEELRSQIIEHLDRDDLESQIDTFIDLAEARHAREVRIREMRSRVQATIDSRYADLPSNYLEMMTFRLLTDPLTVLTEVSLYEMNRLRCSTKGRPKVFTVHQEIEFDREPAEDITAEMIYYEKLLPLSETNTTNALSERAPDAYLYAALLAAEPYLANDPRIKTWTDLYVSARNGVNDLDQKRSGPLFARVAGATP